LYLDPDILDTPAALGRDLAQPRLARALRLCRNEGVELLVTISSSLLDDLIVLRSTVARRTMHEEGGRHDD